MAVTVKWVVIAAPAGKSGTTGEQAIAEATTVVEIVDNGNGTVTIYYV